MYCGLQVLVRQLHAPEDDVNFEHALGETMRERRVIIALLFGSALSYFFVLVQLIIVRSKVRRNKHHNLIPN